MTLPNTTSSAGAASEPLGFAVVTGGGAGIGRALCQQLSAYGWAIAVVDIDEASANRTMADLPTQHDGNRSIGIDVAQPGAWQRLRKMLKTDWPRLDLLINNAGILTGGELAMAAPEEICRQIEVNLTASLLGCQALAPWMIDSAKRDVPSDRQSPRSGIINMSSIFAPLAPPGFAAYSAAKAGIVAMSTSLRGELAPHGLNVTVTLPGVVRTSLFERATFATPTFDQAAQRFFQRAELEPENVAAQTLRAANKGRARQVIGRRANWFDWFNRLAPSISRQSVARRAAGELGIPSERIRCDSENQRDAASVDADNERSVTDQLAGAVPAPSQRD